MGDRTAIEWAANADGSPGATWNPIVGCAVHTPGCTHCYAMREAARIARMSAGSGRASAYAGLTVDTKAGPVWTGEQRLVEAAIDAPLRWKRQRTIFAGSMSDWFVDGVSDETLDSLFMTMRFAHWHTFIVLTKRAERMRDFMRGHLARVGEDCGFDRPVKPAANIVLGVSAEDQTRADERIPLLLDTPAAVRVVSCEPLLGEVRLDNVGVPIGGAVNAPTGRWASWPLGTVDGLPVLHTHERMPGLDWVIAGGESGPGARPMHPDWARSLRDQCAGAATPFFFKQWGEWAPEGHPKLDRGHLVQADGTRHEHAGETWMGEFLRPGQWFSYRVGKRAAGRLLDGRTHDARPSVFARVDQPALEARP